MGCETHSAKAQLLDESQGDDQCALCLSWSFAQPANPTSRSLGLSLAFHSHRLSLETQPMFFHSSNGLGWVGWGVGNT